MAPNAGVLACTPSRLRQAVSALSGRLGQDEHPDALAVAPGVIACGVRTLGAVASLLSGSSTASSLESLLDSQSAGLGAHKPVVAKRAP